MNNNIKDDVLRIISLKQYHSEIELPAKVKQNYIYIEDAICRLVADGKIALVGCHFSDKFGKLFNYYTARIEQAAAIKIIIESRQYKLQRKALITRLLKQLEEHGTNSAIKIELELIQGGKWKVDNSLHQLKLTDIMDVYMHVIIHGKHSMAELDDSSPKRKNVKKPAKAA